MNNTILKISDLVRCYSTNFFEIYPIQTYHTMVLLRIYNDTVYLFIMVLSHKIDISLNDFMSRSYEDDLLSLFLR